MQCAIVFFAGHALERKFFEYFQFLFHLDFFDMHMNAFLNEAYFAKIQNGLRYVLDILLKQ